MYQHVVSRLRGSTRYQLQSSAGCRSCLLWPDRAIVLLNEFKSGTPSSQAFHGISGWVERSTNVHRGNRRTKSSRCMASVSFTLHNTSLPRKSSRTCCTAHRNQISYFPTATAMESIGDSGEDQCEQLNFHETSFGL